MNWQLVPKITGGLACLLALAVGIIAGIEPAHCLVRGVVGGVLGWVLGALWAFILSRTGLPNSPTSLTDSPSQPQPEGQAETNQTE